MKKVVWTIGLAVMMVGFSFAQSNVRQGLKAKTYKLWNDDSKPSPVFHQVEKEEPKSSLEHKNAKVGAKSESATYTPVKLGNTKRSHLKGLQAKHYKPWKK